uniref:Uncharacterized protein n=1 Tax=Populus davidiana TaxID=266767 RepID=A0A6M2EUQ3_9ROSI
MPAGKLEYGDLGDGARDAGSGMRGVPQGKPSFHRFLPSNTKRFSGYSSAHFSAHVVLPEAGNPTIIITSQSLMSEELGPIIAFPSSRAEAQGLQPCSGTSPSST